MASKNFPCRVPADKLTGFYGLANDENLNGVFKCQIVEAKPGKDKEDGSPSDKIVTTVQIEGEGRIRKVYRSFDWLLDAKLPLPKAVQLDAETVKIEFDDTVTPTVTLKKGLVVKGGTTLHVSKPRTREMIEKEAADAVAAKNFAKAAELQKELEALPA